MMGLMTGGTVSVGGEIVRPRGPAEGWRRGFAYVPRERRTEGLLLVAGRRLAMCRCLISARWRGSALRSTGRPSAPKPHRSGGACACAPPGRASGCGDSAAAISRRSCSPARSPDRRKSFCSTSRRAASTSAPNSRSMRFCARSRRRARRLWCRRPTTKSSSPSPAASRSWSRDASGAIVPAEGLTPSALLALCYGEAPR